MEASLDRPTEGMLSGFVRLGRALSSVSLFGFVACIENIGGSLASLSKVDPPSWTYELPTDSPIGGFDSSNIRIPEC